MVSPPIGWRVQYLNQGDEGSIFVADVTFRGAHGAVKLNTQPANGGTLKQLRNYVRHVDDPHFKEHPQSLQGIGCGAWRYLPGMEYKPNAEEKAAESVWDKSQKEARDRVAKAKLETVTA